MLNASSVVNISDAASLALHAMMVLAKNPDRLVTTHEIAQMLGVSENHLSKVCQRLGHGGLVSALRGPSGGLRLAKPASDITLMQVFELIDGPMTDCYCLLGKESCPGDKCILGNLVRSVSTQVRDYLSGTTVEAMAGQA